MACEVEQPSSRIITIKTFDDAPYESVIDSEHQVTTVVSITSPQQSIEDLPSVTQYVLNGNLTPEQVAKHFENLARQSESLENEEQTQRYLNLADKIRPVQDDQDIDG